jgi:DNA polymerase III epsilon subunit-like protein
MWKPLPIWAHNADFDRGFISALASRNDLPKDHLVRQLAGRDSRWSCTRYLAEYLVQKGRMEMPRKPDGTASVSLDPLMERLGIPGRQTEAHDAHEDVRLGVVVLDALLRRDGWWDT